MEGFMEGMVCELSLKDEVRGQCVAGTVLRKPQGLKEGMDRSLHHPRFWGTPGVGATWLNSTSRKVRCSPPWQWLVGVRMWARRTAHVDGCPRTA